MVPSTITVAEYRALTGRDRPARLLALQAAIDYVERTLSNGASNHV
jgi:hypothetical protein